MLLKIFSGIAAIFVVLFFLIAAVSDDIHTSSACEAAGGVKISSQSGTWCVKKSAIIDLKHHENKFRGG